MKPVKILKNVTNIKEIDKDNVIFYFDNGNATIADKKTFSEKYDNVYFEDWYVFNEIFYIAKRKSDKLKTLIYKESGKCLNENLWFTNIVIFNDEFFKITSEDYISKTLIYQKDGECFNSDIWEEYWEIFNDNYFKVSKLMGDYFKIVNKNQRKLICENQFSEIFDFDENLFVVKTNDSLSYTFIRKENGEFLNENLHFEKWYDLNDEMCLVYFSSKYHFINKTYGTINYDLPSILEINPIAENDKDYCKVMFNTISKINVAILRTSDCTISPIYYNIKSFNNLYFAAYLDNNYITLMRRSDFSLLCNHLCVHKNDITAYPESDYFSIKKDCKVYLYK